MSSETMTSDNQALMKTLLDVFGPDAVEMMGAGTDTEDESEFGTVRGLEEVVAEIDEELRTNGQAKRSCATGMRASNQRATETKHILVQLDQSVLAVPISHVVEVQRVPAITSLPNVPDWLRGVSNLRGEIISVVDGRAFFGLAPNEHGLQRRLIIIQSLRLDRTSGFIFDRVVGMHSIDPSEVKPVVAPVETVIHKFLKGAVNFGAESVGVVDLELLFSCEEMSQFASA